MNDTKQRILDVSLELFSQNGFSAVSIRDICRQVQICLLYTSDAADE